MIPCNLVLDLKNTLEEGNTTPFSVAVVSCVAMRYQITNDINPKIATESPMYYGVGLGRAGTHIITHDIKSTVNKSSDLNVAQALSTGGSSGAITMDRLTEVEQRAKSNTNRLNEHDEILKSNSEMIGAIKELATEVKYMRGDLNETVERLNKLEGKDGDKWDKFKWLIVTGLVTLILGYLAVSVGLK